jgi:class 3 adenylate cyclase
MRSSTAIAERLGELSFLNLLNRFIVDLSLAIAEARGEIHKYAGDEVIATWRLAPGVNESGCVRACFTALDRLRKEAPAYERELGLVADFRAGLHCGPVAVGELGCRSSPARMERRHRLGQRIRRPQSNRPRRARLLTDMSTFLLRLKGWLGCTLGAF